MRIGILIASLTPYGAEKASARLAEGLKKHGADVRMFLTDSESEISLTVPVISMMHAKKLNLFEEFLYAPLQYFHLRRAIKREKVDVLISFMARSNIFNLLLPKSHFKILSIRIFLSLGLRVHGFWRRVFTKFFYGTFLRRADLIVTNSHVAKDDFSNLFPVSRDKLFVLPNPIDLDEMALFAQEEIEHSNRGLLDGDSILHVGRLTRDKGQWSLIRALPRILEAVPDARLILLGDGDMRGYLEKLVSDLNLQGKVHFLGYQQNPLKFMSRTRLLVGSSTLEGFPNTLIEAMVCSTPIVSTDCPSGPRELLAPNSNFSTVADDVEQARYGLLVPPPDGRIKQAKEPLDPSEESLARAVIRMLQDEALRQHYSKLSSERIVEFKAEHIIARWMELLARLHQGKK